MPTLDMRSRAELQQSTTLSPRLQQAVRLLQMSSLDFAAQLRDKLGRNPFLEVDEGEAEEGLALPFANRDEVVSTTEATPLPAALNEGMGTDHSMAAFDTTGHVDVDDRQGDRGDASLDSADPIDGDRALWLGDGLQAPRKREGGDLSALDFMAVETPLNDHLHQQLNLMPLAARELMLARAIVESLDDDGYLRSTLDELASALPLEPAATVAELSLALCRVQSLEPAGVGARTVAECLLLQMPAIACADTRALATRIVGHHLQALAARDVVGLARRLDASPATIEAVCDRIRHLDPRPGWRVGSSRTTYIVPDVIVKKAQGRWTVQLNPAVVPRVRLNHVVAELFQRHRKPQDGEMAEHLQDARWTLRNVEQRFSTILDVAEAIVKRQRHFLEYGAMAMRPLGLKEIADEVGVHESTVSRVTNSKYMATPTGVFELKYFFSRAMVSANGKACSGTAIRSLVQDIIEAESALSPLSDVEITRLLAQQGLCVARRTVTKYRQMLKIESVDRRRRTG